MACSKPPACAGQLRHKITLAREVATDDGAGGSTITWQAYATPRAMVRQLSSAERYAQDRLRSEATQKIVIRYRDGVDASDRIEWQGRTMHITGPPEDWQYRRRWLIIMATEVVTD